MHGENRGRCVICGSSPPFIGLDFCFDCIKQLTLEFRGILEAICNELAEYRNAAALDQVQAWKKAADEGRILPAGFGYAELTDGTHVVFKPKMASFRVDAMEYYNTLAPDRKEHK